MKNKRDITLSTSTKQITIIVYFIFYYGTRNLWSNFESQI